MMFDISEMLVNTVSCWKLPGHHGRTAGRTYRITHRKILKIDPFPGQPIQIRCLKGGTAVTTEITIAPVVRKDENDIGFFVRMNNGTNTEQSDDYSRDRNRKYILHKSSPLQILPFMLYFAHAIL